MLALVLIEIRAVPAERSRGRHNPRAVKRKVSGFPTRSRAVPATAARFRYEDHVRVTLPAVPGPTKPAPAKREPEPVAPSASVALAPRCPAKHASSNPEHHRHVQAWRASGLSRTDYCRQHGLNQRAFHHWVARLREQFRRKVRTAGP